MHYVGWTIDQFRSGWNNYKSNTRKHRQGTTSTQHLSNHFCTSRHCGFLEDASLTFIDKTGPSDPLKRDYWISTLKTMASFGLNNKESVEQFISNMLSICIFIGLERFEDKDV